MFRDGTGANAMFVMVAFTPDSGITFQWRAAAGGACENANLAGLAAPQWVKLVRSGNNFSGYYSSDGIVWSQIGSTKTIAMASAAKNVVDAIQGLQSSIQDSVKAVARFQ